MRNTQWRNQHNGPLELTVLEAVELPAGVAHLGAGLAHVDGDALTHVEVVV